MNRKVKASLKRVFVLLFTVILLLSSVSLYPPLVARADDWTGVPGTGTTVDTPPSGGGSGSATTTTMVVEL